MKLKSRRYSTSNSTLYWTDVPVMVHSLSWATLMLSSTLRGLATKYVMAPMSLLRRDKDKYVRGLAEDVKCHLNANDFRPAYRALKKLRSRSTSQVSAIQTADGCLISDADGVST